jgi:hypothetical protein
MLDVPLGDQVDAVDVGGDDLAGELARHLDRDSLGERVAANRAVAAVDDILHRWIEFGFDPDDFDRGLMAFAAVETPLIRPPPPIGTRACRGRGLRRAFPARPCPAPAMTAASSKRMDEHHSLCGLELLGMSVGIVEPLAVKDDARAMAFGLRDLHRRGADGHDDGHRNAEAPAVISDGLGVVSREAATTPRARSLSSSASNLLSAPRSL